MLPDLSIERSTTVDRVVDALRGEILAGTIAPGTPLRELDLVKAMGVSRGTVREALSILVNEKLLTRTSYRGAVVTKLTSEDIRDLFTARRLIELAAVDAAGQAADEQLRPLYAAEQEFGQAAADGTRLETHEADVRFHTALVDLLGSPRLTRIYAGIMGELRLALTVSYDEQGSPWRSPNPHHEFLQLIADDKSDSAKSQLARRLDLAEQQLLTAVAQGDSGEVSPAGAD